MPEPMYRWRINDGNRSVQSETNATTAGTAYRITQPYVLQGTATSGAAPLPGADAVASANSEDSVAEKTFDKDVYDAGNAIAKEVFGKDRVSVRDLSDLVRAYGLNDKLVLPPVEEDEKGWRVFQDRVTLGYYDAENRWNELPLRNLSHPWGKPSRDNAVGFLITDNDTMSLPRDWLGERLLGPAALSYPREGFRRGVVIRLAGFPSATNRDGVLRLGDAPYTARRAVFHSVDRYREAFHPVFLDPEPTLVRHSETYLLAQLLRKDKKFKGRAIADTIIMQQTAHGLDTWEIEGLELLRPDPAAWGW